MLSGGALWDEVLGQLARGCLDASEQCMYPFMLLLHFFLIFSANKDMYGDLEGTVMSGEDVLHELLTLLPHGQVLWIGIRCLSPFSQRYGSLSLLRWCLWQWEEEDVHCLIQGHELVKPSWHDLLWQHSALKYLCLICPDLRSRCCKRRSPLSQVIRLSGR